MKALYAPANSIYFLSSSEIIGHQEPPGRYVHAHTVYVGLAQRDWPKRQSRRERLTTQLLHGVGIIPKPFLFNGGVNEEPWEYYIYVSNAITVPDPFPYLRCWTRACSRFTNITPSQLTNTATTVLSWNLSDIRGISYTLSSLFCGLFSG